MRAVLAVSALAGCAWHRGPPSEAGESPLVSCGCDDDDDWPEIEPAPQPAPDLGLVVAVDGHLAVFATDIDLVALDVPTSTIRWRAPLAAHPLLLSVGDVVAFVAWEPDDKGHWSFALEVVDDADGSLRTRIALGGREPDTLRLSEPSGRIIVPSFNQVAVYSSDGERLLLADGWRRYNGHVVYEFRPTAEFMTDTAGRCIVRANPLVEEFSSGDVEAQLVMGYGLRLIDVDTSAETVIKPSAKHFAFDGARLLVDDDVVHVGVGADGACSFWKS